MLFYFDYSYKYILHFVPFFSFPKVVSSKCKRFFPGGQSGPGSVSDFI